MQRAVFIMLIAMSLIPAGDTAGKLLTGQWGAAPVFVAWSRFAIGTVLVLPFVPRRTWALFRDWRIWLRAAILAAGITCIQTALQTAPVADVFAAFFIGPILSYVLAAVFLREPISGLRSALIALGFAGVLLVVRPAGAPDPGLAWALIAGCSYGVFLTMSRWLGGLGSPISLVFTQLAISALLLLPLGLSALPAASPQVAALTAISAVCSMLGNLLLLFAYRHVNATTIAPLVYLQLLAAVGLGWAVFGELPDVYTWLGLGIILGAGLFSARLR
ncbi:MAG: DMT family transporter [Sulfitobacter sp.]